MAAAIIDAWKHIQDGRHVFIIALLSWRWDLYKRPRWFDPVRSAAVSHCGQTPPWIGYKRFARNLPHDPKNIGGADTPCFQMPFDHYITQTLEIRGLIWALLLDRRSRNFSRLNILHRMSLNRSQPTSAKLQLSPSGRVQR
jgi:hypothetical protein